MTETKNYRFKKPDFSDPATISPINENFDKVDEELIPYRITIPVDIDMTVAACEENEITEYVLTEDISTDIMDLLWSGLRNRRVRLSITDNVNGISFVVEVNEISSSSEKNVFSGVAANPVVAGKVSRFDLEVYQMDTESGLYPVKLLVRKAVICSSSGHGSSSAITAISVTESTDGSVTMVNTLVGGGTETLVISPDANGNPSKLTYNGTEIPITWTEATATEGTEVTA